MLLVEEDDDYDCDNGDYPSMESEMSLPSPETSLSPRPASLAESMQVNHGYLKVQEVVSNFHSELTTYK